MRRGKFTPFFYALIAFLVVVVFITVSNVHATVEQVVEKNELYYYMLETEITPLTVSDKMVSVCKERERIRKSPYVLITSYRHEIVYDYGTYKQIDSLKCIRLTEMKERAKKIDRDIAIAKYRHKLEEERLEKLNEPCNF